jgi:hypothetical protein
MGSAGAGLPPPAPAEYASGDRLSRHLNGIGMEPETSSPAPRHDGMDDRVARERNYLPRICQQPRFYLVFASHIRILSPVLTHY